MLKPLSRVFVTGLGALTAVGETVDETWQAVCEGKSGIAPINHHDLSGWSNHLGGELKQFQPAKLLPDRKLAKVVSKQDIMGINAAVQAVEHSQMIPWRDSEVEDVANFNDRTAVFVGSPGNKFFQQYDFLPLLEKSQGDMKAFAQMLFETVHPMWLLRILPNNVLAYTGITYQFKGVNHNITNHATSGLQAIIEAMHAIRFGQADRAVVVAYDYGTDPQALYYYQKLGLVSSTGLKPFDKRQDGTILGDGAAAIVLESEASAKARGATRYAELLAGQAFSENAGLFSIQKDDQCLQSLISQTLDKASIRGDQLNCVVAHGNGNPVSDKTEAAALTAICPQAKLTGFKWAIGHTLTASGLMDTVLACQALHHQTLPGIANWQEAIPSAANLAISHQSQAIPSGAYAIIINRGFASMDACLLVKHCE